MRTVLALGISIVAFGLAGCLKEDADRDWEGSDGGCLCTREYRMNVCVTWEGSDTLPESLTFLREREGGVRDSLDVYLPPSNCFGELPGTQRILVLLDTLAVDSTEWFTLDTVDCCHGEARTVDFVK